MIVPDDVARAARRIAAKMVADQGVPIMLAIVGLRGDGDGDIERTERYGVVVVARGESADQIISMIESRASGDTMVEVVPQ